jgi:hypothetical protein
MNNFLVPVHFEVLYFVDGIAYPTIEYSGYDENTAEVAWVDVQLKKRKLSYFKINGHIHRTEEHGTLKPAR